MHRLPRLNRIDLHWFAVLAVPRTAASFVSRKTYRRQPPLAAADAAGSPWNLNDLKKWRPRFPWAIQNEKKKKKESLSTHYAQYMTSISFLRLGNSPHTTRNYGKKREATLHVLAWRLWRQRRRRRRRRWRQRTTFSSSPLLDTINNIVYKIKNK